MNVKAVLSVKKKIAGLEKQTLKIYKKIKIFIKSVDKFINLVYDKTKLKVINPQN